MGWVRCGGGNAIRIPTVLKGESKSRHSAAQTFTYTFTSAGKFQYVLGLGYDTSGTGVTFTLNATTITPQSTILTGWIGVFYNEIDVSANDVLTITVPQMENMGAQFFVFKEADVSNLRILGLTTNNGSQFDINLEPDEPFLEVFQTGYYNGANNFYYIVALPRQPDMKSIPVLGSVSSYYWGYTYVITI